MTQKKSPVTALFSLSGLFTLLACLPVLALLWTALQGNSEIWDHLLQYVIPPTLIETGLLLFGVGILTILIGTGSAWLVTAYQFRGRGFLDWALLLPLAVPTYIIAYSYIDILHPIGPVQTLLRDWLQLEMQQLWFPNIRSLWGAIFLLSFVLYPYVYLSTRAMFLMQSASLIEVARSLGLKPEQVFFRVAIPLARPAIAVGASLALMETINDIGATEFLGIKTLTLSIYSTWTNQSDLASAAQIAIFMLLIISLLVLAERLGRRKQRYMNSAQRSRLMPAQPVTGAKAWLLFGLGLIPVIIGFLIPISHLLVESYQRLQYAGFSEYLLQASINTLTLASIATFVTMLIGFMIVSTARFSRSSWLSRVASLGYAIPGTVLAIGLMLSLGAIDHAVADFLEFQLGLDTGLLFLGTSFTLIYAYAVRFLAISIGGIESGYNRIHGVFDDAAHNLGQSKGGILTRIHLPLLRPALISAALLIFVDCMKELPATLLLRPLNMETLATQLYTEASRGTYEEGAIAALLIVLVGLIPVILLARLGKTVR
ncbi:iron ABC transporter permease [Acinetobacter indicus]|uniref:ABC transporter permease n=1 Tax=Acinetobacter TaxID=469 RepID=UPI0015D1CDEF|nr:MULTISPECIES: iron ABC transporter permease [Acinetobacter]MCP0916931.1 iron ABC transporter permease [Acinetobacter indicus]MCP0920044.1 iron ABC transporter permease [Acinetobacter indicus]MCP0922711.1 iron ABC transporter permease [Acinetobacter indicus]QSQ92994.1 iron ABC transporter permease [Acinetobacter indicus]UNW10383.1 iron ABC transporter permease [Acinetobacter indicus]